MESELRKVGIKQTHNGKHTEGELTVLAQECKTVACKALKTFEFIPEIKKWIAKTSTSSSRLTSGHVSRRFFDLNWSQRSFMEDNAAANTITNNLASASK
ncbi:hypothetical protein KIN20_014001 [Parelaphostrongylus tenuis]|uniref:Uncharacterized protein n=1 Tax=Parelaphostrongylus tenuis TaxID=148309 RepID=A0AAD5QN15_PARTN|nr:hypothetical protein KIN20_014001 [Parelaphostrongylus tenuis]